MIDELANAVFREKPTDRGSFIACITLQLGTALREIIDSHNTNSVIFIIEYEGNQLLLKAEFGSNTATHKEADWYVHLGLMSTIEPGLFLGSVCSDTFALVILRYVKGAITLDDWALEHPSDHGDFGNWLLSMLEYDKALFALTARTVPKAMAASLLTSKYDARRKEAATIQFLGTHCISPTRRKQISRQQKSTTA